MPGSRPLRAGVTSGVGPFNGDPAALLRGAQVHLVDDAGLEAGRPKQGTDAFEAR
jgi:hypothetical protein